MKYLNYVLIALLTFLAVSSAIAKISLIPIETEFYGKYAFSNPALIAFGIIQLLGGVLLVITKTRALGASAILITFLISFVLLLVDDNVPVATITLICVIALGFVIKQSIAGNSHKKN